MNQNSTSGLWNLAFNVIIPVYILNKLTEKLGGPEALLLALAFPLGYGAWDLIKNKKWNAISLLGILNVSVTGGLALMGLEGIWFSVKEAFFPLLIGVFVWLSVYFGKKPLIETLFLNPQIIQVDRIEKVLEEKGAAKEFHEHLKQATIYLAGSFFVSAALNFILAQRIFLPIDPSLGTDQRNAVLNSQIAEMTSLSFFVIALPSMILMVFLMWYLFHGIKKITGLGMQEFMRQ